MKPITTMLQFLGNFAGICPLMHTSVVVPVDFVWSRGGTSICFREWGVG